MISLAALRHQPQHLATIAGWVHAEWWAHTDAPVQTIADWLATHLGPDRFPTTIVALEGARAIGSVSLHASEAPDRPAYTPYLGALYVVPQHRGRGLGPRLVRAVEEQARELGYRAVYLNANTARHAPFYAALGWREIETGYGARGQLAIMQRDLA